MNTAGRVAADVGAVAVAVALVGAAVYYTGSTCSTRLQRPAAATATSPAAAGAPTRPPAPPAPVRAVAGRPEALFGDPPPPGGVGVYTEAPSAPPAVPPPAVPPEPVATVPHGAARPASQPWTLTSWRFMETGRDTPFNDETLEFTLHSANGADFTERREHVTGAFADQKFTVIVSTDRFFEAGAGWTATLKRSAGLDSSAGLPTVSFPEPEAEPTGRRRIVRRVPE